MFRTSHISTAAKIFALALLTLAFASSASASACTTQGQNSFQTCIENMGADGSITAWEEGVCSRFAADIVTECERQTKPGFQPLAECYISYTYTIFWDDYLGEFSYTLVFTGPLVCA